jgi:outer membrane protein assembly factor BamB
MLGFVMARTLAIALLLAVVLSSFANAIENGHKRWWPQFRGPASSGVGEGRPPVHFGIDQKVLWKTAVGSGLSSPTVWKGHIFLTEFDRTSNRLSTLCLDRRSGKILWTRTVAAGEIEKVHEISSPASPTPATDGERVYVYFGSYGLVSYDLNGKQVWEKRLPLPENPYGAVASPIIAGELLVLNHQGKDAYLLGVDRRDGHTVWKTDRSLFQYGWSTPVHWRHDGIDEIVVLGGDFKPNQRLMAYNLADGAERWWVGGLPPCGKSTPVVGDGLLFFAAPDIILEPVAEKKNPARAEQIYANNAARVTAVRPGKTGEVSQSNIAWSERRGVPGVPSPLYYKGFLYSFSVEKPKRES